MEEQLLLSTKVSRVKKTLLNARVNFLFYTLTLALTFFSRKIFLECLGANFLGLAGTLQSLLGYLNLAELGIGAAISFNLFKPIQEGNSEKIKEIISLYGYYYRNIGLVILCAGLVLSAFIPLIFPNTNFSYGIIYFAFYTFLFSSLLGYFINYRAALLSADQRNYVVTGYFQTANILKTVLQMSLAYYFSNYYLWVIIELMFGVLGCIILNVKINKVYPWLKCSVKFGKTQTKKYPNILKSAKQIFIHKIKDFILTQSDSIFIYAFVSLKMVAYYGNYGIIIAKLTAFFGTFTDSIGASVGNLVAENDKRKITKVFWELMAVRYYIAGFIVFCCYHLLPPFISLWLGSKYVLGNEILILMLIILFIGISRGTIDNFNHAYGHYSDVWSAWAEGIINVVVTIICGYFYGLAGILIGKIVSLIPIIVIWKPLYLFKYGFKERCRVYWKETSKYYLIFAASAFSVHYLLTFLSIEPSENFTTWIIYSIINTIVFALIYFCSMTFWGVGGKNLIHRLPLNKFKTKK